MAKVLGVGGIFFKSENPEQLGNWYQQWLGVNIDESFGGSVFMAKDMHERGYTIWAPFKKDTEYFQPSNSAFMINLVVDDLEEALKQVAEGGAELCGEPIEEEGFGKFGWFLDPEGNKVELWQP